jgi:hypothetical protein
MRWERKGAFGAVPQLTCQALRRPRRVLFLTGVLVLLAVFMSGCGRSQSSVTETNDDYQVTLATDPAPAQQGAGTVIVVIKDKQGQGVDAARVSIEGNMSHAGMKPEYADSTIGASGEYHLPLSWTMGGSWYVDVKITLRNGEVVRRRFPVDVK